MNTSNYEVIRQIGGGQEGRIFLAHKDRLPYALKELLGKPSEGELHLLSSINHPGVIRFHEALVDQGTTLVLEYASEGTDAFS